MDEQEDRKMEIEKLKHVVKELPEEEAKSLLFHILLRVNLLKEKGYSEAEFVKDVKKIYRTVFDLTARSESKQEGTFKMVHILFGDSPAGGLKVALKNLGVDQEERVISFWDMFSVGPIWHLHEEIGKNARMKWMNHCFSAADYYDYTERFQKTIHEIHSLPEDQMITIWVAENAHEQTGLRYVLHLLNDRNHDVVVFNTTKLYRELFHNSKIEYTVLHTGEISPEKLEMIYKQGHISPLTQYEREDLEQEWLELSRQREHLRIWRNGRIVSVPEDYYDQYIIHMAKELHRKHNTNTFMKSARLIGHVLGHLDQYVGDGFLEYRVRKLIENGVFEMEGNLEAMRFYSVRLKKS